MKEKNLKLLSGDGFYGIYYVKKKDKISVDKRKIYKEGYCHDEIDFDLDKYFDYFDANDKPMPAHRCANCSPNLKSTQPGIEIHISKKMTSEGGSLFYHILEHHGMMHPHIADLSPLQHSTFKYNKIVRNKDVYRFLVKNLYKYESNKLEYSKNLIDLIEDCHPNPETLYSLQILGASGVEFLPFEAVNLHKAAKNGIFIDINRFFANYMLGLFGTSKK